MSGCEIWQRDLLKLPDKCFDGYPLRRRWPRVGLSNVSLDCELRRSIVIFMTIAATARRFTTQAPARERRRGPVARPARCGQSLALRRRHSQVRHSGPVHRTPDTAGGLGLLNELRHIGKSFLRCAS
jgi:hypothetical protein